MTTRIGVTVYPTHGERFGPDAFSATIGKSVGVDYFGQSGRGVVLSVTVASDGTSAWFTVELEEGDARRR